MLTTPQELLRNVSSVGWKLVLAVGAWDCLHVGHVRFLQAAASLGHWLVVSADTDANLARRKPGRPIIPLEYRAEILSALRCVTAVVSHDAESEARMVCELRPDVLAKSEEYRGTEIPGAQYAGRVVFLPRLAGWSTTEILSRPGVDYGFD